jgi:hypothetical protein
MCVVDLEQCSAFVDNPVKKARKEHVCDCCHRTIAIGEPYIKHFSVFDGDVTAEKCCTQCHADRVEFSLPRGHAMCPPSGFEPMLLSCVDDMDLDDEDTDDIQLAPSVIRAQDRRWRSMLLSLRARKPLKENARSL